MMTTESTSQNFLLLLKKKNRRIQGNTYIFRLNRRMWRVAVLHV